MEEKIEVGYDWQEEKKPRKGLYSLVAVLIAVILIFGGALWNYNSLMSLSEEVSAARAQIESNIQRKADLLPNLVRTVKAYARHEKKVFGEIAALRSRTLDNLRQHDLKNTVTLNKALDGAMLRLLAVAESYPDLKSSEQFRELQAQIEGAENRINITRMNYNEAVRAYNAALRRIPGRWIAPVTGLKPAPYFRADEQAQKAMKLEI